MSHRDCHTCAAFGRPCDRQRPQCTRCLGQGKHCGGYPTALSWDANRTWLNDMRRRGGALQSPGQQAPKERQFTFVMGPSRKRRKPANRNDSKGQCRIQDITQDKSSAALPEAPSTLSAGQPTLLGEDHNGLLDNFGSVDDTPVESFLLNSEISDDAQLNDLLDAVENFDQAVIGGPAQDPGINAIYETENAPHFQSFSLHEDFIAPPLEKELSAYENQEARLPDPIFTDKPCVTAPLRPLPGMIHQHEDLLTMYNTSFCILPLTADMNLNPFRIRQRDNLPSPSFVAHAVLALSCQHLNHLTGGWATKAVEHRSKADLMLAAALSGREYPNSLGDILDAILIMITQDCALSALGTWNVHLRRALEALNAAGAVAALDDTRVQSQVAMLVWWDATLALVSRHGCMFDMAYVNRLLEEEKHNKWSFYDITGCPGEMVRCLVELACLAKQAEIGASYTWLTFDTGPVSIIEERLNSMKPDTFGDSDTIITDDGATENEEEEVFHAHQDQLQCIEAWRLALLLYIQRVFMWDRMGSRPPKVRLLVRSLLNCVSSCRRTSQTQKQMLLPVFLAGSECFDEAMRQVARGYCDWWVHRSHYYMFDSVSTLLDEVWAGMSDQASNVWWGGVIDEKTKKGTQAETGAQFLFG
ncbi:uncharacterized protein PV06_11261 [Exophiala oligosperma]|uniref:Zn(2)-C6 fungal-type domain-containing protein n=1 Tax=Exophiala oligosperma TaxID=215243 RepID=A0A0D2DLC4_9EURO|nr:uncharacterized protein PV06_11261 [Exophiala oligosperma]KIW36494.1 hypothetical protein PV06_11261 [Exophiala oligosperma]